MGARKPFGGSTFHHFNILVKSEFLFRFLADYGCCDIPNREVFCMSLALWIHISDVFTEYCHQPFLLMYPLTEFHFRDFATFRYQ